MAPRFNAQAKFSEIYNGAQWGNGSGEGSFPENTTGYRKFLQQLLVDLKIKSVVDLGCGDWQFSKLIDWGKVRYTGIDVVPDLIQRNQDAFGTKRINFLHGDIQTCSLPQADMIIIKDVLQHWPTSAIRRFVPRLKQFKYALITNDNYPDPRLNGDPDVQYGHFRPLALREAPFHLRGEKVFEFRTDSKMPKGFKNKEVLLVEYGAAKPSFYHTMYSAKNLLGIAN